MTLQHPPTDTLVRAALDAYQAGDTAEAERLAGTVLEAEPRQAEMLNLLGLLILNRGDLATASTLFQEAVEAEPRNTDIRLNLAETLRSRGLAADALGQFRKAVELKPDYATLLQVIGSQGPMNPVVLRAALEYLQLFTTAQPRSMHDLFQLPRLLQYSLLSDCKRLSCKGGLTMYQPCQTMGEGAIELGEGVTIGWIRSPFLYSGACYLDARTRESFIRVSDRSSFNNNFVAISEGAGIDIAEDVLIGVGVSIHDANFHHLDPALRHSAIDPEPAQVKIERNVFIGDNVKVLKGVTIGENSVIANASVVSRSIPAGVIAAGVPARVIKEL